MATPQADSVCVACRRRRMLASRAVGARRGGAGRDRRDEEGQGGEAEGRDGHGLDPREPARVRVEPP